MTQNAYAQDGVNVIEGDRFSSYAGLVCRQSWKNSPYIEVKDYSNGMFRGPRTFRLHNLPPTTELMPTCDGVGTKVGLHEAALTEEQAAIDLFAMLSGDLTRWGALPCVAMNVLDVSTLGEEGDPTNQRFRKLAGGMLAAARKLSTVIMGGETAELGVFVGAENPQAQMKFNWEGFMIGAFDPLRLINGSGLKAGQIVYALREYGFRSNGISGVRSALRQRFGSAWYSNPDAADVIRAAATPSTLYDHFLAEANGWGDTPRIPVTAIAHLSGGGIPGKFGELLKQAGLSAELYDLWDPPTIMKQCAEWRRSVDGAVFTDRDIYATWNGGQGALVVMEPQFAGAFEELASYYAIDVKECGRITPVNRNRELKIMSKFDTGKILTYTE